MKLDDKEREFYFHGAFLQYLEDPTSCIWKCLWFMPMASDHMCLEYLTDSTDVVPHLPRWQEGTRRVKRVINKTERWWMRCRKEQKWVREHKQSLNKQTTGWQLSRWCHLKKVYQMKARKEWRTDKGERIWVVLGPVEAIDHSNYPLFSSNKAGTLRQSSGRSSLLLFSKIQFHSSLLCLLHIKHFLQLFLFHSYLDYLTPQPIQSDCSFHQTLLESIPGSFQMGWLRLWVCVSVCVPSVCSLDWRQGMYNPEGGGLYDLKSVCKWKCVCGSRMLECENRII